MDDLKSKQETSLAEGNLLRTQKPDHTEVVSLEECQKYLGRFGLSDEQISAIKNNLIGIVDSVLSAYLNDFR